MISKALLLGAGNSRVLKVAVGDMPEHIFTLDMDASSNPDILWNLEDKPWPIEDNDFNQIHAYEVLEHLSQQGDWQGFFDDFAEIYRILKPNGYLVFSCPKPDSIWAWGDPGHRRIISEESVYFLDQDHYAEVGTTSMTDYRGYWKGDFKLLSTQLWEYSWVAVLQARK